MIRSAARLLARPALVAVLFAAFPRAARAQDVPRSVYVAIADSVPGSLDEITTALRGGFAAAGWDVLAAYQAGAMPSCDFRARILVLQSPGYSRVLLARGHRAAFAVPVRLAVFQDERGTHVAMVNPLSINRTIVDERGLEPEGEQLVTDVARIVHQAAHGTEARRPFGQQRNRGYIGRTMGIMAGGPFVDKIETVSLVPGGELGAVADRIWASLQAGGHGRWQIRGLYRLDFADQGLVVFGVSGPALETRAFEIVRAGGDDARSSFRCPGLAYAAAFPVEVVARRDSTGVRVTLVNEMYRMKMYFEDAGKMKFAANMGMPGSVEDEIRALLMGAAAPASR